MNYQMLTIVVSIFTFVLGSSLTWWLKAWEQKRAVKQQSIIEARRLTNEWYNQLQQIFDGTYGIEFNEAFARYLNNRIVLPELLMHLEVLRKHKDCNVLVLEIENFLRMLTTFESFSLRASTECVNLLERSTRTEPKQILADLDPIVQRISVSAGTHIG